MAVDSATLIPDTLVLWLRGLMRTWPVAKGKMSRNATIRGVERTGKAEPIGEVIIAGSGEGGEAATMPQKGQDITTVVLLMRFFKEFQNSRNELLKLRKEFGGWLKNKNSQ